MRNLLNGTLVNIVQSQVGWFACVLSAAADQAWVGLAVVGALILAHVVRSEQPKRELGLVLVAAAAGALVDTLLVQIGAVNFASSDVSGLSPAWMIALWAIFATTLRHSLSWLQSRLALSALIAAIGATLAYAAGARLGALQILDARSAYLAIGALWALALPALLWIARRLRPR